MHACTHTNTHTHTQKHTIIINTDILRQLLITCANCVCTGGFVEVKHSGSRLKDYNRAAKDRPRVACFFFSLPNTTNSSPQTPCTKCSKYMAKYLFKWKKNSLFHWGTKIGALVSEWDRHQGSNSHSACLLSTIPFTFSGFYLKRLTNILYTPTHTHSGVNHVMLNNLLIWSSCRWESYPGTQSRWSN